MRESWQEQAIYKTQNGVIDEIGIVDLARREKNSKTGGWYIRGGVDQGHYIQRAQIQAE
jgi:hypothetical protein